MHYNGQLRASQLILGCVPSYTSYQDSSDALTIGSPLLSYLDVRLLRILPHGLTSGKARHQGGKVRQGLLKPVRDGSAGTVFHSRVECIPVKSPTPFNSTIGMVQRCTMALDHWFPCAQPVRGQTAPWLTSQQTTSPMPR